MLTAQYTGTEFKSLLHQCMEADLLPWQSGATVRRERLGRMMIRLLTDAPFLYPAVSWGYTHFFLSWVYPRLDRNRN